MKRLAIRAQDLSKRYRIVSAVRPTYGTLYDAVPRAVGAPVRWLKSRTGAPGDRHRVRSGKDGRDHLWALKEVSFDVRRGEIVGIVGRNGAGKTTLLKVLSSITEPTSGRAELYGRVGSLLEVGAAFHPELTGRENVYLNGAVLGMTKGETSRKFEQIVAFAELERFVDTPLKFYSSGMSVRLAFAVAAHLEPEILLVDEVLAVGDAAFQKKCLGKMGEVAQEGRTVLFVSHNMGAIRGLCRRGIWLEAGEIMLDGLVDETVEAYLDSLTTDGAKVRVDEQYGLFVENVTLETGSGVRTTTVSPGGELVVKIRFHATKPVEKPYVWLTVQSKYGACFAANMLLDGKRPDSLEGRGTLSCRFRSLPLLPQTYAIRMAIRAGDGKGAIVEPQEVTSFSVIGDLRCKGFDGELLESLTSKSVPVVIPYEWILPDGTIRRVRLV